PSRVQSALETLRAVGTATNIARAYMGLGERSLPNVIAQTLTSIGTYPTNPTMRKWRRTGTSKMLLRICADAFAVHCSGRRKRKLWGIPAGRNTSGARQNDIPR